MRARYQIADEPGNSRASPLAGLGPILGLDPGKLGLVIPTRYPEATRSQIGVDSAALSIAQHVFMNHEEANQAAADDVRTALRSRARCSRIHSRR
jgi:hypothetical protein